jgi:hypothetical protein
MRFAVNDIIGAPISAEETDYRFDYTDPAGKLDENGQIKAFYGLVLVLSGFLIFIRLYISIFGRRMRNEGNHIYRVSERRCMFQAKKTKQLGTSGFLFEMC